MRHVAAGLAFAVLLLAGCENAERPTAGGEDAGVRTSTVADSADLEAKINGRINDLFPQPEKAEAHKLFDRIKDAVDAGDLDLARDLVSDLFQLAAATDLKDPEGDETTAEAYSDFIDLLLQFVGLDSLGISPELLAQTQDDDDGTVAIASGDQDNAITTEEDFAGTFIPDEALPDDEDVVIVIEQLTEDEQSNLPGGECLPTGLEQEEGCYQFDRFPEGDFQSDVEVGVCAASGIVEEFQLHKFESVADGGSGVVEPLPNIPLTIDLQCDPFTARSTESPLPWRLAEAAWRSTGGRLIGWLGPQPLEAVDIGFGGSTTNFSRIGWAKGLELTVFAGDGQTAVAGEPVSQDPTVEVRATHSDQSPPPVQTTDVTFTVTGGGGTIAGGQSTATVTTSNGLASVPWTLGSIGTNTLEATVPGDTARFTATAVTGDRIFVANFDDEPAGAAPQDPVLGTWTVVGQDAGTIEIRAEEGDLTNQPVVFDQEAGLTGGLDLVGATVDTPSTGVYEVRWEMLGDTVVGGGMAVRDDGGFVVAAVSLRSNGDIRAETAQGTNVDTGEDWVAGVHRDFRLVVDLDSDAVSLFIDGQLTSIQDQGFRQAEASNIARVDMSLGGQLAQLFAFDNVTVDLAP